MGEARRRGNFEERKTQAIDAGRVKVKGEYKAGVTDSLVGLPFAVLSALLRPNVLGARKTRK